MSGDTSRRGLLGALQKRFDELRLAVLFLTRVPVGRVERCPPLADAVWAFPLAGAIHGLIVGLIYAAALSVGLTQLIAALLAVAAGVTASGALHEDGLADCADGFGGGASRERKLEIMRDSRIGTYGTIALVIALGLRAALIAELDSGTVAIATLVGLGALTRGLLPLAMLALPPARDNGAAADASDALSRGVVAVGVTIGLGLALMLVPSAPVAVVGSVGAMALVSWIAMRHIEGVTGDVLGAAQVAGEIGGLLASNAA